ncbi:MAG TPA: VOC family protein [Candidatus Limnocylindria bacterium]|nr:VOC family protein [Candidatus Limnocylindria bacterium]
MPAHLDHLLWASADLDAAVAALEKCSGVRPAYGGSHPELGTHNALAALGERRFLELLAPDPMLKPGPLARQLSELRAPVLLMWAARVESAAEAAARAEAAGYRAMTVPGHRPRPDGRVVRWTNVFVSGHGAGTLVPFFIDWHDGGHPADDAPEGLTLVSFVIEAPRPEHLSVVLATLDVDVEVREAEAERLVAVIDSPLGRLQLVGPAPGA